MKRQNKYKALIVLGGGRDYDGNLTDLSKQRLDRGIELYEQGRASKIFAIGGFCYNPKSIRFDMSGAKVRRDYLISKGVREKDVIIVEEGGDTIIEAIASRKKAMELDLKDLILVTSDRHMKRALWIFRRVFPSDFEIKGIGVSCGDLLNEGLEKRLLEIVQSYFNKFPAAIHDTKPDAWYDDNQELYREYRKILMKYNHMGKSECQAYIGIYKNSNYQFH